MLEEDDQHRGRVGPAGSGPHSDDADLEDPSLYFNRELSWLDFNERVLELAEDSAVPLLERVKFCAIYASNLDEFFMVRVAGLFDQVEAGIDARGADGLAPGEQIDAIQDARPRARRAGSTAASTGPCARRWRSRASASSRSTRRARTSGREIDQHFHEQVFPALTPLVIGLGRPFPYISNLSLSLGGPAARPGGRAPRYRPGQGPEGAARGASCRSARRHRLRPARGRDRRQPRRPLPRHRGDRPRLLPGHPRRRLQHLRRGG